MVGLCDPLGRVCEGYQPSYMGGDSPWEWGYVAPFVRGLKGYADLERTQAAIYINPCSFRLR